MHATESLGTVTFTIHGSIAQKTALLTIDANPTESWPSDRDLFLVAGWLLLVECETTFIPPDLLPLAIGTLIGKMHAYFKYGIAGKSRLPDPRFEHLATAELSLSLDRMGPTTAVSGWPNHKHLHRRVHPGALVAMMITDSPEAVSNAIHKSEVPQAFHVMTFGLEKWARRGFPKSSNIPSTWDLLNISEYAKEGERIVKGGWLGEQQDWPLRPFVS